MSNVNGIPKSWCLTTIKEVCDVVMGSSPPGESYNSDGNGMPLVNGPVEFGKGPLDKTIIKQYTANPTKTCKAGDLLLCVRGSTTGRTNVAGFDAAIGRGVAAIRADVVEQSFVNYYLVACRETIYSMGTGSTFPNIRTNQVLDFRIPLAPLNEQRRIVAKIEELFSNLDAGVAALKRIRANLKRYRAAVLKAAVEGKLTEEWRAKHPKTEPASKLLERMLTDRRQKWEEDQLAKFAAAGKTPPKAWREKYVEPAAPDTTTLPELPQGWCWATVEQITENHDGMRIPVKAKDRAKKQGPYPYYGASGIIDHVDGFLFDGECLLIAEDGANLLSRSTPIAFRASGRFWVNNHAHVVTTHGTIPMNYVELFFNATRFDFVITGTAQPKLTQAALNRIALPIPPLPEQEQIVAEVDRLLSIVEESEAQVGTNLKRATRLRQSILKRAFEGRLVPQDPTDEPADKLLERIRQERVAANGSVAPRTRRGRAPKHQAEGETHGAAS